MIDFTIKGGDDVEKVEESLRNVLTSGEVDKVLTELGDKIMGTLKELFSPAIGPSVKGQEYKHGYKGRYLRSLQREVKDGKMTISDNGDTDPASNVLLTGTSPMYGGGQPPHPIGNVVDWAMEKLGVSVKEAFAIGMTVAAYGVAWEGGNSPILREHPSGSRYIDFPEWILKVRNAGDVDSAANKIGDVLVSYIDRGKIE